MKIDVSTIEGFEEMSAEDKVQALLGVDLTPDLSGYVKKEVFDAKATEAANLSKQLKTKMTDDETKAAEAKAAQEKLENDYKALLKKSTIADHTARYLALGYDEKLAKETAEALYEGDMDKVFENQSKFKEAVEKKLKADLVNDTPRPGGSKKQDDEDANVEFARELGKQRAATMTSSVSTLDKYKIGK